MLLCLLLLLVQQALQAASIALRVGSGKALDVALAVAAARRCSAFVFDSFGVATLPSKERVQHNSTTPATRPDPSQITLILKKRS
jgi:hypothetical protein